MNELFETIPWNLIAPLIVIQFILIIVALTACLRSNHTNGPKWLWVLIIIFVNIFGPIAFFIFGRRNDG